MFPALSFSRFCNDKRDLIVSCTIVPPVRVLCSLLFSNSSNDFCSDPGFIIESFGSAELYRRSQ